MRGFGVVVAILGVIGVFFALNMTTSVSTGFGEVQNIGLLNDRQNYIIVSSVAIIAGLVMALFAPAADSAASPAQPTATGAAPERQCPHCAEMIKAEAKVCRFCNNAVEPTAIRCDWCDAAVAQPGKPCSANSLERLISVQASIKNTRCREEVAKRIADMEPI